MRTILWFIYEIVYLIASVPDMIRYGRIIKRDGRQAAGELIENRVRNWARSMLRAAGVTVEVYGYENLDGRPSVIIANHQSDWDIPVILGFLDKPHGLMAKDSLARIPIVRTWMKLLGCVFIDRKNARNALRGLSNAGKAITEGESIIIFPEGTRSKGEEAGEFKPGAFKTAFKYGAPIVPVSIDGTYKIMEENNGKWIRPAHVILTFLPPVEVTGMGRAEQKELALKTRSMILEAREESRRKAAGNRK